MLDVLYSNPRLHRLLLAGAPRVTRDAVDTAPAPAVVPPAESGNRLGTALLLFGPPVCVYLGIVVFRSLALGGALGLFLAALLVRHNTRRYLHMRSIDLNAQLRAYWPGRNALAIADSRDEIAAAGSNESWLQLAIYTGLPLSLLLQAIVMASHGLPAGQATLVTAILTPVALLAFFGSTLAIMLLSIKVSRFQKKITTGSL